MPVSLLTIALPRSYDLIRGRPREQSIDSSPRSRGPEGRSLADALQLDAHAHGQTASFGPTCTPWLVRQTILVFLNCSRRYSRRKQKGKVMDAGLPGWRKLTRMGLTPRDAGQTYTAIWGQYLVLVLVVLLLLDPLEVDEDERLRFSIG